MNDAFDDNNTPESGSTLRPSLAMAEGMNANAISFSRRASRDLGIPEQWVKGDLARIEREMAARRIEKYPALELWARQSPENAALARDDTDAMAGLAKALAEGTHARGNANPDADRTGATPEYDPEAGALSALAGPYAGMDEDAEKGMNRQILAASSGFWGGVARPLAASAQAAAENLYGENSMPAWLAGEVKAWIESVTPKLPEEGDSFGQYWLDAAAFVPQLAGQLAAGAMGGPPAAGAFGGATQFGSIYADLRDKGVSPQASASSAGLGASVNAVLDSVGTGSLLDMFKSKGARDALVKGLAASGIEPLTEFIQAFPENFATLWGESELHGDSAYDRLSWFAENFFNAENLGSTAEKGAYEASFALLFGGVGGAGKFMSELSSVAWTRRQRRVHDALAASKLGKEHPELAAAALEEIDPEQGRLVSIPADKALELLQRGTDIMTPLGFDAESAARHAAMGRSLDVRLSDVHTRLDAAGYDAVERIMVPGPRGVSLDEMNGANGGLEEDAAEVARLYEKYAAEQSAYDAERERLRADVETAVASVPNLKAQAESMAGGVAAYAKTVLEPLEGFARRMEAIGVPRTQTLARIRMRIARPRAGENGLFQGGEPIVRDGITRKSDEVAAKVVNIPENAVPEFSGMKEFANWLKDMLAEGGDVNIVSTGQTARFTRTNVGASVKRSRSKDHRNAYAALREMVENAEYDHYEAPDARHPHGGGQDVYHSALAMGGKLYSVKLKLDVVAENVKKARRVHGDTKVEDVHYKDHRLTEIEIAPALYRDAADKQPFTQPADAISEIKLGVLRGSVKPSGIENGTLFQPAARGFKPVTAGLPEPGANELIERLRAGENGLFQGGGANNPLAARFADMSFIEADSSQWFGEGKELPFLDKSETTEQRKNLRNAVKQWAKKRFSKDDPVVNGNTGWQILVTPKGIENSLSHGFDDLLARSVPFIPRIIEGGIYLDSIEKKPGLMSHIFANKIRLDGQDYVVAFVLREDGNGNRFYDHELTEIIDPDRLAPVKQREVTAELRTDQNTPTGTHGLLTNRGDVMNILRDKLGVNDGTGKILFQTDRPGTRHDFEEKLARDVAAWEKTVDGIAASGKAPSSAVRMLAQTPLVMDLLGKDTVTGKAAAKGGIYAAPHVFDGSHPNMTPEMWKQIPAAMADPIAVFDSDNPKGRANGDLVFMLEVKDANGATVVVPVALDSRGKLGARINIAKSAYAKEKGGTPSNLWFVNQMEKNARYINGQKIKSWGIGSGATSPLVAANSSGNTVFTETDLVKLRNENPGMYQDGGESPTYPNNGRAVGAVSEDIAKTLHLDKAGDIVLDDVGLQHIEDRHGTEIRGLGFRNGREFVDFVLENLNAVYDVDGKGRKYDLVSRARTPQSRVMVRLEFAENGDFYQVVTAGTVRKKYYDKKTPLWESANLNHSTSGTPDAVSGQSGVLEQRKTADAKTIPASGGGVNLRARHKKTSAASARGSVQPTSEGYLVSLFSRANLSTLPHELGHIFRMEMQRAVDMGLADEAMLKDHQSFEKWLSRFDDDATLEAEYNARLKNGPAFRGREFSALSSDEIARVREIAKHEYFARGFEAYLREGKAPTRGLEGAFRRFRDWLVSIYRSALKLGVELNDDVREAFDNILTTEREMKAEAMRNELLDLDERQLDTLGLSGPEREYASGLMKAAIRHAADEHIRSRMQNRKERFRDYERQAREALEKEPVYAALEAAKENPLDRAAVAEAVGQKDAESLASRYPDIMHGPTVSIPVVVRGDELGVPEGADIREYIAAAKKYHDALKYESEHGTPVRQPQLDRPVRFSSKGWRKNAASGANPEKWMLFPKLREIIGSSTLVHSGNVNKPRKDGFVRFHWVEADIELSGRGHRRVGLMLAEDGKGNLFYNLNADVNGWKHKSGSSKLPAQSMAGESEPLYQDAEASLKKIISPAADNVNLHILSEQDTKRAFSDPELLARERGYKSAAAMISDMLRAEPLDAAVQKRAKAMAEQIEARLFRPEEYLFSSEEVQERLELVARHLSEKSGETVLDRRAFAEVASRELASMEMGRAVSTGRFLADLRRALRQERNALRAGNVKAAMDANNKVRLNLEFARQSRDARKKLEAAQAELSRFLKNKSANPDAKYAVMLLTMNHGLGRWNEALARGRGPESMDAWFSDMADRYEFLFDPATIFNDARPWREMTLADFTELHNAVKQIMKVEFVERTFLSGDRKRDIAEIAAELAERARREYGTRPEKQVERERLDAPKKWLRTMHAQLMKVEFLCNMLDGGEHGGIWERTIFRPIAEAEAARDARLAREVARMRSTELFGRYDAAALRQKTLVETVGEAFTLEQRIMVALNMGNDGNRERLKAGFGWTDEQLADIVSSLSKEDWEFVSNVWTYLESFRPEAFAVEKALTGIEPKAVEARPFMTPHGEVRGGYFPVAYDPEKGAKAFERAQKRDDTRLLGGRNHGSAQTAHGHLKARANGGTGEPLDLSFSVIGNHVFDVVHDFTFRIPVLDVAKVLRNKEVRTALRETVGPELANLFMPWLQDVSMMRRDSANLWEKSLSKARALTTVYGLGYKLTVLIQQGTGYLQTIDAIGAKATGRGLKKVFGNITRLPALFRETCELSPMMATRMESFDRDIKDIDRRIVPRKGLAHAADAARDWSMKCIGLCQMGVDLGTWWGAYEKRMSETGGDMRESVAYADSVVRMTQGGGGTKDLSRVQRGSEVTKLFTMFYGFFNVQYNMWARRAHLTKSLRDAKKAMNTIFLTAILGPILSEIPAVRWPDEDDDETWLGWGAKLAATYPFMTIPVVRDVVNGIAGDYGYRMTPLEQTFKRVVRLADAVKDAALEEDGEWSRAALEAAEIGGVLSNGLITQQTVTVALGLARFLSGDDFELSDPVRRGPRGE